MSVCCGEGNVTGSPQATNKGTDGQPEGSSADQAFVLYLQEINNAIFVGFSGSFARS